MAKHTQMTDQKIINSGAMQYLMPFPAAGRVLRMTNEGAGLNASIEDALGQANDATPFQLALRTLRIEPLSTPDQVSLWAGPLEFRMPFPAEGRVFHVKEGDGGGLEATVADELGCSQDALPFTYAFRSLHAEPVLDPAFPFAPYAPGWFYRPLTTGSTPPSDTHTR